MKNSQFHTGPPDQRLPPQVSARFLWPIFSGHRLVRAFLAASLLCGAVAAAYAANVREIVKRVQARYDATKDFRADVVQQATIISLGKTVTARGTVAFKKPGKMRWDLTQGDPQIIVSNGHELWIYRPEDQQAVKMAFSDAFQSTLPLSFLTGVGRIADDFTASIEGVDENTLKLLLLPRRAGSDVGKLLLSIDRNSYDITGAEITDPLGNTSRLQFEHMQRNQEIPDDVFQFTVPPGVDVMNAPTS